MTSSGGASPAALDALAPAVHAGYIAAYADSLRTVFAIAVPIAVVAFALTWILPEIRLRGPAAAVDPGETYGMPEDRSSLQEVERALSVLARRENRPAMYQRLADSSGLDLDPRECWLLLRLAGQDPVPIPELADRLHAPAEQLAPTVTTLTRRRLLTADLSLSQEGRTAVDQLRGARRAGLRHLLDGWSPTEHPELTKLLDHLAHDLPANDPPPKPAGDDRREPLRGSRRGPMT